MSHHHHPEPAGHGKAFALGIILNAVYVIAEVFYGLLAHSSALVADAVHNAGDVLGMAVSWLAVVLALKKPSARYTYGLKRMSILSAILNALIIFVSLAIVAEEAVSKFHTLQKANENTVIWVAAAGILINGATAWLFMAGRKEDLNIKSQFLHMAGDAGIAFGVVVAGILIKFTGAFWIDPVMCLIIVIVVAWETWDVLKDSVNLALDAVPENISVAAVKHYLQNLEGVKKVYDLHIWGMSTTQSALSVHLFIPGEVNQDKLLRQIKADLHERFEIVHPTIQITGSLDVDEEIMDCLQS